MTSAQQFQSFYYCSGLSCKQLYKVIIKLRTGPYLWIPNKSSDLMITNPIQIANLGGQMGVTNHDIFVFELWPGSNRYQMVTEICVLNIHHLLFWSLSVKIVNTEAEDDRSCRIVGFVRFWVEPITLEEIRRPTILLDEGNNKIWEMWRQGVPAVGIFEVNRHNIGVC